MHFQWLYKNGPVKLAINGNVEWSPVLSGGVVETQLNPDRHNTV